MASFEDMAGDLTATIHEVKAKKEKLKAEIEQDEEECDSIEEELAVLLERRQEIQGALRQHTVEKEELVSVIGETEETKLKIMESLKFLGANLKKYRAHQ